MSQTDKWANSKAYKRLYRMISTLNNNRLITAIRSGFLSIMPLMIVGSFATLINNLPIPPYQAFMLTLFGENWKTVGSYIWNGTFAVVSLASSFSIASNYAKSFVQEGMHDANPTIAGVVGFSAAVIMAYTPDGLPYAVTGATGLFVALLSTILSSMLYISIMKLRNARKGKMFFAVGDAMLPQAFGAVIPAVITLAVFGLARALLNGFGISDISGLVTQSIVRAFDSLRSENVVAVVFNLVSHLLWMFGIHGNNALEPISEAVFVIAGEQNMAAFTAGLEVPHIYTKTFFDAFVYMGGSGTTLALMVAILLFSRRGFLRMLGRYALPTSIFNINEPLMYGMPIVLNPLYLLPFILTPLVMMFTSSMAMSLGLVPRTIQDVDWTSPILISGYVATGSIAGSILQVINLALGVLIYMPFVRISEKLQEDQFKPYYDELLQVGLDEYQSFGRSLVDRDDGMGTVARRLANDLRNDMQTENVFLMYQPIVDAHTGKTECCEALLRWKHPDYGMIPPPLIIALAENMNLIHDIGLLILNRACRDIRIVRENGHPDMYVAVNISTRQLMHPNFVKEVQHIVAYHNLPPSALEIEVTESLALGGDPITRKNVEALHNAGIQISIDDFGMGHSSLLYLKRFPASRLKVDGALTRGSMDDPINLDIIQTILNMCKVLGINTVLEWVETAEQAQALRDMGADFFQGYYYSPALVLDDFQKYIDGNNEK